MKKLFFLLLFTPLFLTCSDNDDDTPEVNYIDNIQEGIIGTWENIEGNDTPFMKYNENGVGKNVSTNKQFTYLIDQNEKLLTINEILSPELINTRQYTVIELTNKKMALRVYPPVDYHTDKIYKKIQ
jgi:hypothetical protein